MAPRRPPPNTQAVAPKRDNSQRGMEKRIVAQLAGRDSFFVCCNDGVIMVIHDVISIIDDVISIIHDAISTNP